MVQKIFKCGLCKKYYRIGKSRLVDIESTNGSFGMLRQTNRVMICQKCWGDINNGDGLVADKYSGCLNDIVSDYVEDNCDLMDYNEW